MKFIFSILFIKCIGCFAYYWVYFCYYPAGFNGDSISTLHDAKIMYDALPEHPGDFMKMVFGFHSDLDTDPLYQPYFYHIEKWGRADISSNFFLNDNRTPIRINAVIMLFSFGSYAVHAFVMLALSFIGQYAFYKAFQVYFPKKEMLLAMIIFLTPSVLFWTSGVLKEPIAICLLGLFVYGFMKLFIEKEFKIKYILLCVITVFMFLILKPYILILVLIPIILFAVAKKYEIKRIAWFYISALVILYGGTTLILKIVFQKDVIKTIVVRQNDFINLSHGGTFFLNEKKYVRFELTDTTHYDMVDKEKQLYRLQPHSAFMYWKVNNIRDTIYETNNRDTSLFKFISRVTPSGSAIDMDRLEYKFSSFAKIIPRSFLNVLTRPFFFDSHSILELMASLENLLILLFFIFCFCFRVKDPVDKNLLLFYITLVICAFILVGITTTVTGAIVRYKTPFIPFLLMVPLLYLDPERIKKFPLINHLVK
ncbi:MAG: hypothetical protein V4677_07375 [Bacteroidota bacterium]